MRGGNWNNNAQNCRSANRNNNNPSNRNNNIGFRLASARQDRRSAPDEPDGIPSRPPSAAGQIPRAGRGW
ncbi:MAG TPA: hypothetical protein PKN23_10960 [Candidatus Hydrogenedentes bacterium]|nr:hypothetical protein [Candidatus Hydrogenedentota bacterium]HOH49503.1 hypothetical protein [Candidatus Hydrogenedentota bacterium]